MMYRYYCTYNNDESRKGSGSQYKLDQFPNFDDMAHKRADMYHSSRSWLNV